MPNGRVNFHGEHPRLLSKEKLLHWPAFTPPASARRRRSSGWFCHRPTQENEEDLTKLRAWLDKIVRLDFYGAPLRVDAEERLERCVTL
ncbi:Chromate resistance protein ChrB, partial [Methylorubrum extorquens]